MLKPVVRAMYEEFMRRKRIMHERVCRGYIWEIKKIKINKNKIQRACYPSIQNPMGTNMYLKYKLKPQQGQTNNKQKQLALIEISFRT